MSLPTCQVRVVVFDSAGGAPVAGAQVQAQLSSYDVGDGYVVPRLVVGTTDIDGEAFLDLWPNQLGSSESFYTVTITAPNGKRLRTIAVVPNQASADLQDIAELPPYEGKPEAAVYLNTVVQAAQDVTRKAQQVHDDAETATTAAGVATQKASDAGQSASNAATSASSAAASDASAGVHEAGAQSARESAMALARMDVSFALAVALSTDTTGPNAFFSVPKGGTGPDGVTQLARTTCFRRTGVSTGVAFSTMLDGVEFDAIAGSSPGTLTQIFETLDPGIANTQLLIDPARRVIGQMPDPRVGGLQASALTAGSFFETLEAADSQRWLLDADRRILLRLADASKVDANTAQVAALAGSAVASGIYETLEPGAVLFLDAGRRILGRLQSEAASAAQLQALQTEVAAARGNQLTLAARVDRALTPYGDPLDPVYGRWYLRETRQRLRKRALGEAVQFVCASVGDSWTHNRDRWCKPVATSLIASFGDAGSGWTGFGNLAGSYPNGNIDNSKVTVAYSGSWDYSVYFGSSSPDIGQVTSTTPGDKMTITGPAVCSLVNLFRVGTTGVLRYRWDAGAWTTLDTSGSGLLYSALAGLPATAWTLEIENVSGTITLQGMDIQKSAAGVRWHKLGATGSSTTGWISPDATQWKAGLAALAPNLVITMLATNDQGQMSPSTFRTRYTELITRQRAALPYADLLLIAPCENQRVNTYPMSEYARAAREIAVANRCAFIDLQYFFGDNPADYAAGTARPWFNADLIHPEPLTGGRAIADAVLRVLLS